MTQRLNSSNTVGARDVFGKYITERLSPWVRAPSTAAADTCTLSPAARGNVKSAWLSFNTGEWKTEKVTGFHLWRPFPPCLSSYNGILKEAKTKGRRKLWIVRTGAKKKLTISCSPSYPHFTALLDSQDNLPPLDLPPTPSKSSGHHPLMQNSWFCELFRMWGKK